MNDLEKRIEELEKQVQKLSQCNHQMIPKKNPYNGAAVFFNGTNAYTQCEKCGKRFKV